MMTLTHSTTTTTPPVPPVVLDPETHVYTHRDGHRAPSVTQIIGFVPPWRDQFKHVDPETLAYKAALGRAVHLACEYADQGVLDWDALDPAVRPYVDGWQLFRAEKCVEVLEVESCLYHPTLGYAGTLDRILRADRHRGRGLVCADIKTGASSMAGVQTAAYLDAWRAMRAEAGSPIDAIVDRWTVQLLPTGRYTLTEHTSRRDFRIFLAAFELFTFNRSYTS